MITNERLQELIKYYKCMDVDEDAYGNERVNTDIRDFHVALQELLTLRHEKQLLIENSERLAEIIVLAYLYPDHLPCAIDKHNDLMKQVKRE